MSDPPGDGTEKLECEEIAYRALKRSWVVDEDLQPEAFIRRIKPDDSIEDAVSLSRAKYSTARECRLKLKRMPRAASLHVGRVRGLPLGLDVEPAPCVNEAGETDRAHCSLTNLPDPREDSEAAESAASELLKAARLISEQREEEEHRSRRESSVPASSDKG
jgi:hypothetical protein